MKKVVLILATAIAAVALCFAWSQFPCAKGAATEWEALAPYVESLGEPLDVSPVVVDGQLGTEYSWKVGSVRRSITLIETDRGWGVVQLYEYPEGQ